MKGMKGDWDLITYDFEYHRPASIMEALQLFDDLQGEGKNPIYFSGGTEIITLGRLNAIKTGAVIDIKQIPDCQAFQFQEGFLITGAANRLTYIEEADLFPLLSKTVSEIADRTARNKITVGGNVCGEIFYREAVLPFLLTDSLLVIAGRNGIRKVSIHEVFNQRLLLESGEFLVKLKTDKKLIQEPFVSIKKRRQWNTGYPLITIAALKTNGIIRAAISGLTVYPFRSIQMEEILNNNGLSLSEKIDRAVDALTVPPLDDSEGSFQYRLFVLKNTLQDVLQQLEEGGQTHA